MSKHVQLFDMLGFKVPKYAHISPLLKEDDGKKIRAKQIQEQQERRNKLMIIYVE